MSRKNSHSNGSVMVEVALVLPIILTMVFGAYSLFKVAVRDAYVATDVASSIGVAIRVRCSLLTGSDLQICLDGMQKQVRDFAFSRGRNVDVNLTYYSYSSGSCVLGQKTSSPALGILPSPYDCAAFALPSPSLNVQPLASMLQGVFLIEVYLDSPLSYFLPGRQISSILVV